LIDQSPDSVISLKGLAPVRKNEKCDH